MSADCTGWVYKCSPFKGATFQIHHAIAEVANDMFRFEFWMTMGNLADKARVTRGTATHAVAELVEAGLLAVLDDQRIHGHKPSRYRFLMPSDCPVVYDPYPEVRAERSPKVVAEDAPPPAEVRDLDAKVSAHDAPGERSARTELEVDLELPETKPISTFDRFWSAYPLRQDRKTAEDAWNRALKRSSADPEALIEAAQAYADDPNREDGYTKRATTWLNGECWTNGPLPARLINGNGNGKHPPDRFSKITTDRSGESGRISV